MNGSETSIPSASPLGADQLGEPLRRVAEAAAEVEHPVAGPRRMRRHRRVAVCAQPAGDEIAVLARRRSNSGPLQASVASRFAAATGASIASRWYACQAASPVLERPPAANPVVVQLEEPGHLVLPGRRAVLVPAPDPPDQRQRPAATGLGVVLVELLQLDRLLHPTRRPRRPQPRRLDAPCAVPSSSAARPRGRAPRRTQSRSPLVEGADELADRVVGHAATRRGTSCTSCRTRTSRGRCGRLCRARP